MLSPEISPQAETELGDVLASITIHYHPGEDPYWTEGIWADKPGQDRDNDGDRDRDQDEYEDEDGEWLHLMLGDPIDGRTEYASGADGFEQPSCWMPSSDSIMVHLEEESCDEQARLTKVFMEPSGIDTSILRKLREGNAIDDTQSWQATDKRSTKHATETEDPFSMSPHGILLSDSEAIAQLLNHQNSRYTGLIPHNTAEHFLWQSSLLRSLAQHDADVYSAPFSSSVPHVLSDPLLTSLWVRSQMQGSWTIKYRKALAVERAALKAQGNRAELTRNEDEKKVVASNKRRLRRKVFNDCVQDAVSKISNELHNSLHKPLQDIEALATLCKGQQYLLLSEHYTLSEAFTTLSQHEQTLHSHLQNTLPNLFDCAFTISALLNTAACEMRKMQTRYNRLCANDVKDSADRRREMEKRLGTPEALVYILKSWGDLEIVGEAAGAVGDRLGDVERGLSRWELVGGECCGAIEAVVLVEEMR
ncbi:MAG: hypothetical protein M1830_003645 [Pleopsidium flavum]|nr:MAG: hypothetical protein M1830_003645 [Pleopsidium flavum]